MKYFRKKKPQYTTSLHGETYDLFPSNAIFPDNTKNKKKYHFKVDQNMDISIFNENENNNNTEKIKTDKRINTLANELNIGYYLLTPILIGVIFGLFIKHWLNLGNGVVLMGIIAGLISSMYNLFRFVKNSLNE